MQYSFSSVADAFEYFHAALDACEKLEAGEAVTVCLDAFGEAVVAVVCDPSEDTLATITIEGEEPNA